MGAEILIPSLIGAGASLFGAGKAASASQNAAKTQAAAAQQAGQQIQQATNQILPVMQGMYQQGSAGLQPYQQMGTAAGGRLSELMGLKPQAAPTMGQGGSSLATMLGGQPAGGPQMVTLVGPDGSPNQVPQEQVEHWLGRGARMA